ncbi:MAG: diphthamide biosynthesis enzyme Dph2 [Euryarchaeota archaeon]|nr:diphthamide biosynthesis enzyme Dph2 [Euryarchaeota archaeon]
MVEKWTFADYDLELDGIIEAIRKRGVKSVGLQFPDGLRDRAADIARGIEKATGISTIVSGDPCYGACDLSLDLFGQGVELLVHFGHAPMPSVEKLIPDTPIMYVRARSRVEVEKAVEAAVPLLTGIGARKVGIVSTAQHSHKLPQVEAALVRGGFEPLVGKGDNRLADAGQLLGCNYTAGSLHEDEVDCFLYVGTGDFHPLGLAMATGKPMIVADPVDNTARDIAALKDKILRQRYAAIARAQGAKKWGVFVGTKVGQNRLKYAHHLKRVLEADGREAVIISVNYFSPDILQYFRHLGAWVNTSCPRIAVEDVARYPVPMLTPQEVEIVLGRRKWEDYKFDEIYGGAEGPDAAVMEVK